MCFVEVYSSKVAPLVGSQVGLPVECLVGGDWRSSLCSCHHNLVGSLAISQWSHLHSLRFSSSVGSGYSLLVKTISHYNRQFSYSVFSVDNFVKTIIFESSLGFLGEYIFCLLPGFLDSVELVSRFKTYLVAWKPKLYDLCKLGSSVFVFMLDLMFGKFRLFFQAILWHSSQNSLHTWGQFLVIIRKFLDSILEYIGEVLPILEFVQCMGRHFWSNQYFAPSTFMSIIFS